MGELYALPGIRDVEVQGRVVASLDVWTWRSPFHYYGDADPLRRGLDPANAAVLAAPTIVFGAAASRAFERREFAA